ncbi:MAG: LytTR family transcriptional regulator [Clostridia bacterium]|nr:LytTR family transcriptional regulator [Clostridia bacterium]
MKFTLIVDETREEEVQMFVHRESPLSSAVESLVTGKTPADKLVAVGEDGELLLLPFDEVECIFVLDTKTFAHTTEGKRFRLKSRLYEIEAKLPPYFLRINKSCIANEHHLRAFHPTFSGGVDAVFASGFSDYVSRRAFSDIKRRYL